ncbi:NUDIX hydrolase [Limibacter armeniacum]|uniref:NUDIX hydrolase n=1 Tax=Limibacter armeniacum TaxID=466084 RepID=UPI002FE5190E
MKKVEILEQKRVLNKFLKVDEKVLKFEKFDGTMSEPVNRLSVERGDACAGIIYNREKDQYVLVNQFRHATYEKGPGWLLEMVAGSIEEGETPESCMIKEIQEESGYKVDHIEHLYTCYASPGSLTERIFIFYAEVMDENKISEGGGVLHEHEDIKVVYYDWDTLWDMLVNGEIEDAKTIIGIQWVKIKKKL